MRGRGREIEERYVSSIVLSIQQRTRGYVNLFAWIRLKVPLQHWKINLRSLYKQKLVRYFLPENLHVRQPYTSVMHTYNAI